MAKTKNSATVWVEVIDVDRETQFAIRIRTEGPEAWIPKSQIVADSEVQEEGDYGWLGVPLWLAEEKDLPYETELSV